jgi:hypothetical protein
MGIGEETSRVRLDLGELEAGTSIDGWVGASNVDASGEWTCDLSEFAKEQSGQRATNLRGSPWSDGTCRRQLGSGARSLVGHSCPWQLRECALQSLLETDSRRSRP